MTACRMFVGTPERGESALREMEWCGMDWTVYLWIGTSGVLLWTVGIHKILENSSSWAAVGFSRGARLLGVRQTGRWTDGLTDITM
jgi:hypothetical protein